MLTSADIAKHTFSFISLLTSTILTTHPYPQVNSNKSAAELCPSDFGSYKLLEQRDYVEQNPDQLSCYCNRLDTFEQSADKLCQHYLERNIASQVRGCCLLCVVCSVCLEGSCVVGRLCLWRL